MAQLGRNLYSRTVLILERRAATPPSLRQYRVHSRDMLALEEVIRASRWNLGGCFQELEAVLEVQRRTLARMARPRLRA